MLPADQLELITAAVDGELSTTEVRVLQRLLRGSPEARVLYAKLKHDRDRVRSLPQTAPPADLKAKILAQLAAATPAPRPKLTPTAPKAPQPQLLAEPVQPAVAPEPQVITRMPAWVPVALAASLLLCVTAGSFAYFNHQSHNRNTAAKITSWSNDLPAPQAASPAIPAPAAPELPQPDPVAVAKNSVSPVPPLPMPKVVPPHAVAIAPEPRPVAPDLLGHQLFPKLPNFDLIQVRFPFLRAVAELDRDDAKQELLDELNHELAITPYRFDLFVRDTARGVEVFQHAAKATGLTVFADASTLEKLKKKQVHAVVIYTEVLTPAELTALFARIATEDIKYSPRVCDSLHATPVLRYDEHELQKILGRDIGLYKRSVGSGGHGTGQGGTRGETGERPVSAGTIDSVTKTLTKPPAKPGEKPAVLMTWQAVPGVGRTIPAHSNELKQFLAKRGDRKPDVVPAVIVIRPVG